MRDVRRLLDGAPTRPASAAESQDNDRFERALMVMPTATPVDALPFYDDGERVSFARSRWVGESASDGGQPALRPPLAAHAFHEAGIVLLRWEADPATLALAEALPQGQSLGWRVYRGLNLAEPELAARLGLQARRWRDDELPLAASRVRYQVWAVVTDGDGELIAAEPGRRVELELPERFELELIAGDEHSAEFRIHFGAAAQPLSQPTIRVSAGQTLRAAGQDTGLRLTGLAIRKDERLTTHRRLDFRADGSLVLDPATDTPRTSETQVLVSVRRLIATLSDPLGVPRTLELDLP